MPPLPIGAIIAIGFEKWDVGEEIDLLERAGIRRVQIYRNVLEGVTAADVRRTLDEAGLEADSLHGYIDLEMFDGPPFDLSSDEAHLRRAALQRARQETAYAAVLGCRDVILHPVGPGETAGDAFRPGALASSAEALARIAEAEGARFFLENMPPPMFGCDAALLRRTVDAVDSPGLGLAYDSGHAMIAGDPVGVIHAMGPRLWGVHLHDNDGSEDAHFLPGMGVIPFEEVARALAEVGYGGTFMLEIYRDTDEVRRDLTDERLAYIRHLQRVASGLE